MTLAGTLVVLCFITWSQASHGTLDTIALGLATAVLMITSLMRPCAIEADNRWWVWVICTFSLFYFLGFQDRATGRSQPSLIFLAIVSFHIGSDLILISLGKSFSIMPARRKIKTTFPYNVVRHPVYALYIIGDICFVLAVPTIRNIVVLVCGILSLITRSRLEERVLSTDPQYVKYTLRTQYRLFPGIF